MPADGKEKLMNQPYVLAFVGQSTNGILRWGTEKVLPGFEKHGLGHRLIDLLDPGWTTELGDCLAAAKPAFCFSFEGAGTGIRASNNENLWVHLGVPFITHINDHPYHCPRQHCAEGPGIYRLFSCEDLFKAYVRYFQSRTYAGVLELGYPENPYADRTPWKQREHDIVFVKTGADSKSLRQNWQAFPSNVRSILEDTVELVLTGGDETVASLCEQVFRNRNMDWGDRTELFFSVCSMADFYVRARRAERMVSALMRHDALIVGDWPHIDSKNARARFATSIPASELDDLYAKSRVVVNTLPAIRYGVHPRIPAGFHAKASLISESTPYLEQKLSQYPTFFGVDIDGEGFASEVDQALTLALHDPEIDEKIRFSADLARRQFSFDNFVQGLIDHAALDQFRRMHDAWRIPLPAQQTASRIGKKVTLLARASDNAI